MIRRLATIATLLVLAACSGGGGGGGNGTPNTNPTPNAAPGAPAPSGLAYQSSLTFLVGQAITPVTPTVTGSVSSFSSSPSLPAGLSLDAATGVISGTPAATTPAAIYTITASNAGGTAAASVSITVSDAAPVVSYGKSEWVLLRGGAVTNIRPTSTGGAVFSWSVQPALPAGLTLNPSDGSISGTPVDVSAPTPYSISAQNSGGVVTVELTISVESGELVNLGHSDAMTAVRIQGSRVLSHDDKGRWVLWNLSDGVMIATSQTTCVTPDCVPNVNLAGETLVVRNGDEYEIRSASDGQVRATLQTPTHWWALATDGSYIAAGTDQALRIWSTASANVLLSVPGNFSQAKAFAAPGEIRLVGGPAGAKVVQTISLADGSSTQSPPFPGDFHSWFTDGNRFLTRVSNVVSVYSKEGVPQDTATLYAYTPLAGQGDWFWSVDTLGRTLSVYAVGASTAPAASFAVSSFAKPLASGLKIGVKAAAAGHFSVIDLSGPTPSKVDYPLPVRNPTAFAAGTGDQWLVGDSFGALQDPVTPSGTPIYFGYGAARSIAGGQERVAIATGSGHILYFDAETKELEGRLNLPARQVEISADGSILAVLVDDDTRSSVKIVSLPDGTELHEWTDPVLSKISLSASGQVLGRIWAAVTSGQNRAVAAATGGPVIWQDTVSSSNPHDIYLSPNGSLIQALNYDTQYFAVTKIYRDGALVTALPGAGLGWLDDNRMLINEYSFAGRGLKYEGCALFDAAGNRINSFSWPHLTRIKPVTADTIYSVDNNTIYSLTNGQPTWTSVHSTKMLGAPAGERIVFASGAVVRAEPY